ncbi:hydrogenobyrinate a,c-diamide synthase [Sphaerisporangium melleum]|uniref:Hydrogenobyrinate a,c-diamide synthase n=1 Tax=Sphaerisporangium melleum TaxID=321316 RepID=A0A917RL94_9ACTN|nr:cobyrinate a,c-diamide synthase [Sphaerisporangium melleum]GGL13138.1 hydrogenobyrinate a,c-diamide synthase [Sphaerisporangium melleum]GII69536.1 hydrogenobyrinate a,c-diamide synthase [Sphaerisporangium melleum]
MVTALPRLVIAAPSSGAGKTTVATGLMAAFAAQGLAVSPHKAGPDYIDPGYHSLATGRPGRNLDPWLVGADLIAPLFLHGAAGADIAVIEGVMGLFDGAATPADDHPATSGTHHSVEPRTDQVAASGEHQVRTGGARHPAASAREKVITSEADRVDDVASTAHVARLLSAPVVLVVDVSGQGRSVAALVHGFIAYDTQVRIGGVILNRVGSPRHERICRDALADTGVEVFGAIPRTEVARTPSRHLGLVPVAERATAASAAVAAMGELVAATCDLAALARLAHSAPRLAASPWDPHEAVAHLVPALGAPEPHAEDGRAYGGGEVVVAVAGGRAFTFGYAEQAELIQAAGGTVAAFDPLREESLPEGTGAVVLPGGFPEVYAAELSANEPLRRAVAAFAGPVVAECAGLLYLCRELDGLPMCGLLDAAGTMTDRLTLGYRDAVAVRDSVLTREGERYRGHEFHRTRVVAAGDLAPLFRWRGGADGYGGRRLAASYLHLHWAGSPHLAPRLVADARR